MAQVFGMYAIRDAKAESFSPHSFRSIRRLLCAFF